MTTKRRSVLECRHCGKRFPVRTMAELHMLDCPQKETGK